MGLGDLFYRLTAVQKILLIVGFYAVIVALYYVVVLSSFQFEQLERDMKNIGKDITTEQDKVKKADEIKASIELQKTTFKDLVESLPERQDLDATSKQIDQIANEVGVKVLKFAPDKEEPNKEYSFSKLPYKLTLYGEYKKLGIFFHKLDQLPRLVHIDALTLQPRQGKAIKRLNALPLDAAVVLVTYRRMPEEETQAMSPQSTQTNAPKK